MSLDFDQGEDRFGRRFDAIRRRLGAARDDPRVGAAALAAVAVGAGVYWYRGASAVPDPPSSVPSTTASTVASAAAPIPLSTSTTSPATLVVHVAGAVARPGVVSIPGDARVVDAIDAAGGPVAGADLDRMNLAAPVHDGDRVLVARVGDPPSVPVTNSTAPGSAGPGSAGTGDAAEPVAPIDLNTASAADLETLPGIGPTLAAAIIAERDRRGAFSSIDDLRSVRGIGDKRFAELRDLVTV